MKTDALDRRSRFAPPQPASGRLEITANDLAVAGLLACHGPLPSHYLFALAARADFNGFQKRLTKLFNGVVGRPGILSRPKQQFLNREARYQHLVYDLAPEGWRLLALPANSASDPFPHRLMTACVSASIAHGVRQRGIRFIDQSEIWSHATCPEATRQSASPLSMPMPGGRHIIPDALFGLKYPEGGFRFFALEADRGTESVTRSSARQTAFAQKLHSYGQVLAQRLHTAHWGLPNLTVLTVTTSQRRIDSLLAHVGSDGLSQRRFAFASCSSFGSLWKVPSGLLADLVDQPWRRARDAFEIWRA